MTLKAQKKFKLKCNVRHAIQICGIEKINKGYQLLVSSITSFEHSQVDLLVEKM